MKKIFFFLYFVFFLSLFNFAKCETNIAIIDLNFIVNNSDRGKLIQNELNSINEKNVNTLKIREENIKQKENEIKSKQNLLSEKELNEKIKIYRKDINDFNSLKNELNSIFNEKKNELLNDFFIKIGPIIQEYMKNKSINIIIDKKYIYIVQTDYEITKEVLELINKNLK